MAGILGKLVDISALQSRAGDALSQGVTFTTVPHSLPATNPEFQVYQAVSQQVVGAVGGVELLAIGANASLTTVGYWAASNASTPTIAYKVMSQVFFSTIR